MMRTNSTGIYIHIPFCVRKCNYCDFVSFAGQEKAFDPYVDRVVDEILSFGEKSDGTACFSSSEGPAEDLNTVFIGGGTPSLLKPEQIGRMIKAAQDVFGKASEISMEANPGTFTPDKIELWQKEGINRLSIGVQSFDDGILKRLGRIHDAKTAALAASAAKNAGINFNLDLMLGVPGMTDDIWHDTLLKTIALKPDHISFYSLQIEEGTPFYTQYKNGELSIPSEKADRAMYREAAALFKANGYRHYEVSNAALPGRECRHNLKYWTMQDYIGFGVAAHSFYGRRRSYHTEDLKEYLQSTDFGVSFEESSESDLKGDYIFTELRLTDGFRLSDYSEYFGSDFYTDFGKAAAELIAQGLLTEDDGRIHLTDKGLDKTNPVMQKLLEEL